ncbi:MAG: DNA-directed RNA polymerase sigma-70 factor [Planctomycetota bacterium]
MSAPPPRAEFETACLEEAPRLRRLLRAAVGSRDAEDLAQEILAQAWSRREQFDGRELRAWLFAIARSRIAMHFRRRTVERRGQARLEAAPRAQTAEPSPESLSAERELTAAARQAIAQLAEPEREAIWLKFAGAYGNDEIAALLGVTPGHLGVLLHRALKKVRRTLEEQGHEC